MWREMGREITPGRGEGGYTFGDGSAAARRLELVAEVFEPASRAFLEGEPAAGAITWGLRQISF